MLLPVLPNRENSRLSYPLSYSNAVGLLAALATVFCLHFSADESGGRCGAGPGRRRDPGAGRHAAADVLARRDRRRWPSRWSSMRCVARPRGLAGALLAVVPTSAVAAAAAYGADALAQPDPTTATAVAAGPRRDPRRGRGRRAWRERSGGPRSGLDRRLAALTVTRGARRGRPRWWPWPPWRPSWPPGSRAASAPRSSASPTRTRSPSAPARPADGGGQQRPGRELARGAGHVRRSSGCTASGAGTYPVLWARDRRAPATVNDGHSLYLESLGELGLVGAGCLLVLVIDPGRGAAARIGQGPARSTGRCSPGC